MEHRSLSNEKDLLLQMSEASEPAFEKLYRFYSKRLYGKLLKLLKSEASADEVLQDVFVKVWLNRKNINTEKSFRSYLFQIAANLVCDRYRKLARNKKLYDKLIKEGTEEYSHVIENLQSKDELDKVLKIIEQMPEQMRKVFKLCKLDDKSYKEVSAQLGISESTISGNIVRANHFIRKHMAPQDIR